MKSIFLKLGGLKNSGRVLIVYFIMFCSNVVNAQFSYVHDQSIPVIKAGKLLSLPWTGGINAAQFNTIDLNDDGLEDLVLFDRMANKMITFLNVDGKYEYAPGYESFFPDGILNWILLKDYNCDGKKDLFTGDSFGMKVYRNISSSDKLSWEQFLFYAPDSNTKVEALLTKGFTQKINLQLRFDDLPALVDIDKDGDLDIFNVRFNGIGSVEFHRNFSMERYGTCDSLDYERVTQGWAGFTQCLCEQFVFNDENCFSTGRQMHAGGKALLALDINNDEDYDLLFSEAGCPSLFLMENLGNNESPMVNTASTFPQDPVAINTFPAAFLEDVDFDGVKDLISTPNIYRREFPDQDLKSSTWLYKNVGTDQYPRFTFIKNNFLQDEMIDVGDNAVPAFFDEDGDGDLDMFISNYADSSTFGSVYYYQNIGSITTPRFEFVTDNYADIKSLRLLNIRIQFADLNWDGFTDLAFSSGDSFYVENAIGYIPNSKGKGLLLDIGNVQKLNVKLSPGENFHFTEINHDGRVDVLIGRTNGSLEHWQNIGVSSNPEFYRQNASYLNLGVSVSRLSISCFAADLNSDQKEDLILCDQLGQLSIIDDFHEKTDAIEQKQIVFNELTGEYRQPRLGKSWITAANLFNSKRPALIAGTIRGGLEIFRNEEKELNFDELVLNVYPNPVAANATILIETNLPLQLHIYNVIGQEIIYPQFLNEKINEIKLPESLSGGTYIFKFISNNQSVSRRIILK